MPTIRLHEWTKDRLERVKDAEAHSSYDSVVKTLLRDRQLARTAAGQGGDHEKSATETTEPPDKRFDSLTTLAELASAEEGILFLWCPNCGNEVAHLVVENPVSLSVFETQCQGCLTRLDHHALVAVEIGHPVEERIVEDRLVEQLRSCVRDYWDRTLGTLGAGPAEDQAEDERVAEQCYQYARSFDWEWPSSVPVVALEPGRTYRNARTDDRIQVLADVSNDHGGIDPVRVQVHDADQETAEKTVLDPEEIRYFLGSRVLYLADDE